MMQAFRSLVWVGLLGAVLSGCSHTQSMAPVGSVAALMYPMTDEQADRVMVTAMGSEFPDVPVSKVELPNKGYTATIRLLLDSHQITAVRIPAKGKDGLNVVEGYYFEVNDAGTMMISGRQRASKVYNRLVHEAGLIAKPLPQAR